MSLSFGSLGASTRLARIVSNGSILRRLALGRLCGAAHRAASASSERGGAALIGSASSAHSAAGEVQYDCSRMGGTNFGIPRALTRTSGAGALWARCKSLRCRAEERMASARSVSTFGGRRRRGGEVVMDLALSVLPCYVLALFSIRENRRLCKGSVFLNCGFSETRLIP